MTHFGVENYLLCDQEFPCAYINGDLSRCITYTGGSAWTNDAVNEIPMTPIPPGDPNGNHIFYPTEYWTAFVNDLDFGLLMYSPDHTAKWLANRFIAIADPSYLVTVDRFAVTAGMVKEAS